MVRVSAEFRISHEIHMPTRENSILASGTGFPVWAVILNLIRQYVTLLSLENTYSWFATTRQGGHIGGRHNRIFSRRIYMKIEFSSQRREILLFLTTNMATVMSRPNQQFEHMALFAFWDMFSDGQLLWLGAGAGGQPIFEWKCMFS